MRLPLLFLTFLLFDVVLVLVAIADSFGWITLGARGSVLLVCGGLIQLPVMVYIGRKARAENQARLGQCATCGYSLTGNTSGVCPECGTPVPKEPTDKRPRPA